MKLTNIGGSTGIVEHQGKRILFDPALDDGIVHGSWFHYPPLAVKVDDLGLFDYVYISHIHEDHCSVNTIQHLNRSAEIILMDRTPKIRNLITNFLQLHNFEFKNIHLIKPQQPVELFPGFTVDMVEADEDDEYSYLIDSGLIIDWEGFVIYNSNDCGPCSKGKQYILDTYKKVDLALMRYSAGPGYPASYLNLSHEEKIKEKNKIMRERMNEFIDNTLDLSPKYMMPFADQFVIGGSRSHLHKYVAHPTCPGAVGDAVKEYSLNSDRLQSELILLNSNQSFDFDSKTKVPDESYKYFSNDDREKYINLLQDAIYDYEYFNIGQAVSTERLLGHARERLFSVQKKQNYFPDFYFFIDVPDRKERFEIDLKISSIQRIKSDRPLKEPYLKIITPGTLLVLLLINHISWNMADGALFLDYERVPNIYDPKIHTMLNYLII